MHPISLSRTARLSAAKPLLSLYRDARLAVSAQVVDYVGFAYSSENKISGHGAHVAGSIMDGVTNEKDGIDDDELLDTNVCIRAREWRAALDALDTRALRALSLSRRAGA